MTQASIPTPPTVSVLMAVYNGEAYLRETIDAVLAQTLGDFEFVIVDDASTDTTPNMLDAYDDPRIVRLRNATNLHLHPSLHNGLKVCRAPLVARIDADDICEPHRLERQVAFLEGRPELAGCATWTTEICEAGEQTGAFEVPGDPAYVRWAMSFKSVLYHPTLMVRRHVLRSAGSYANEPHNSPADDYQMLTHLLMRDHAMAVLPERLVRYRRTDGNMSATRAGEQVSYADKFARDYVAWLLRVPTASLTVDDVAQMRRLMMWNAPPPTDTAAAVHLAHLIWRACEPAMPGGIREKVREELSGHLLRHYDYLLAKRPRAALAVLRVWRKIVGKPLAALFMSARAIRCELGREG